MAKAAAAKATEAAEDDKCVITREQFKTASPLTAAVNGGAVALGTKEFGTGTLGWFGNGKTVVVIDGVPCSVNFQIQAFIAKSKNAE